MNFAELLKTKTFYAGLSAILLAIGGYASGEATMMTAAVSALGGVYVIFRRDTSVDLSKKLDAISEAQSNVTNLAGCAASSADLPQ